MNTFHDCSFHPGVSRRAAAALLLSAALAWSLPGFCGPIHEAARNGNTKKVESLLKEQPTLVSSKEEEFGQTPLHIAAFNGRLEVAKLLVANKADVNAKAKNGSMPLHLAAAKGNKELVEFLLASKAEINALDNDGWSPMHSAITWEHKDIAELLSQHGGKDIPAPKQSPVAASAPNGEKAAPKETKKDGRFTAYDDGTVLDTKTNLVWASRDNGNALSWSAAKSYATNYHGDGYTDWRLPTAGELAELYDKAKMRKTHCAAAVNGLGEAADEVHITDVIYLTCTRLWTSEERGDKPGSVTVYDFHAGSEVSRPASADFNDTASRVLLVRANKKK